MIPNLPPKLLREISHQAVQAIEEYVEHITIGMEDEEGNQQETLMPQLTIMAVEAISLLAVYMHFEADARKAHVDIMEMVGKVIDDVALPKARDGLKRADEQLAKKKETETEPADPFNVVDFAIKKAQRSLNEE